MYYCFQLDEIWWAIVSNKRSSILKIFMVKIPVPNFSIEAIWKMIRKSNFCKVPNTRLGSLKNLSAIELLNDGFFK